MIFLNQLERRTGAGFFFISVKNFFLKIENGRRIKKRCQALFFYMGKKGAWQLFLVAKVGKHGGEVAGDEKDTDYDQKDSSDRRDDFEIFSDSLEILKEFMDQNSCQEKGYAKSQRVKHQQDNPLHDILRRRR